MTTTISLRDWISSGVTSEDSIQQSPRLKTRLTMLDAYQKTGPVPNIESEEFISPEKIIEAEEYIFRVQTPNKGMVILYYKALPSSNRVTHFIDGKAIRFLDHSWHRKHDHTK